jgi:RNA polymerase sigma-70 factor (ECF subfamily)
MRAPHGPHEVAAFYVVAEALTNAAKHFQASEVGIRAIAHPKVANDSERSARAWLFTVARNMIIDERRSLRFRYEVSTLTGLDTTEPAP